MHVSGICLSVHPSVCLSGSHTFLVVTYSYVSQATHAFLGMLPLCLAHLSLFILYQVCVFRADRKNMMAALASDWLRHFQLLLWNHWRNSMKLDRKQLRSQRPLPSLCFRADRKTRWPHRPLIGWDILDFSETDEQKSTKLDRKQDFNVLHKVCFSDWSENQDGRLQVGIWLDETFLT